MARVIILGTAAAVNDAEHDYTHFIIEGESGPILIDAGSNPLGKMHKLGIDDESLQDMILTHFHADHVSGVPNMLLHMWLLGRKAPLRIYGLNHCVNRVEDMMMFFSWDTYPNFFPTTFHRVLEREQRAGVGKRRLSDPCRGRPSISSRPLACASSTNAAAKCSPIPATPSRSRRCSNWGTTPTC